MDVTSFSRFVGVLALVAGPGSLLLLALRNRPEVEPVRRYSLALAAAVAATATAGSLWFSEVAGFIPCELCWWQRIAMYPLAVILTVAAVRGDDGVRPYARLLAVGGLGLSVWHVMVQRIPSLTASVQCSGESSCGAAWVDVFGLLTIPTMAGAGFLAIIVLTSLRPVRDAASDPLDGGPAADTHADDLVRSDA